MTQDIDTLIERWATRIKEAVGLPGNLPTDYAAIRRDVLELSSLLSALAQSKADGQPRQVDQEVVERLTRWRDGEKVYGDDWRDLLDDVGSILAALSQRPISDQWRGIESAPKDGTHVILGYLDKSGKMGARSAYWVADIHRGRTHQPVGAWACYFDQVLVDHRATHWMPLPAPPTEGE